MNESELTEYINDLKSKRDEFFAIPLQKQVEILYSELEALTIIHRNARGDIHRLEDKSLDLSIKLHTLIKLRNDPESKDIIEEITKSFKMQAAKWIQGQSQEFFDKLRGNPGAIRRLGDKLDFNGETFYRAFLREDSI